MKPETWQRLDAIFYQALDLPPTERDAFLATACAGDPALRREVEAVLAAHQAALDRADPDHLITGFPVGGPGASLVGERVGAYRLEALVGRGGMGEVYRAARTDEEFEHRVAVKLVRPGRGSDELLRRFRLERQILARLEHPNIAALLDGGVTPAGQPYLVMQYVAGRRITDYVTDHRLGLRDRLELFRQICGAVEFAHANLVVHRDLKPSNILVTEDGQVRLLDFGIAKLLADHDGPATTGELLLLTPEHAAPEQFVGGAVTTATDGYALGVLLYELLVGARPFQHVAPAELPRAVAELEPAPPSKAAAAMPSPPIPSASLRGDLDSIVLQSLRKEPDRRYRTVADLRADVERYLGGYPVQARPDTLGYVAARFVRRHRGAVAATALVAASLVALAAVAVRSARTSRAQAAAITRERDVAVEVSRFLESVFQAPDPYAAGPDRRDTLRVSAVLDDAALRVRHDLAGQPALEARLLATLGRAERNLGRLEPARSLLAEAVEIQVRSLPPGDPDRAAAETDLAVVLTDLGKAADAESLLRAGLLRLGGPGGDRRARSAEAAALGTALVELGRMAPAESAYRAALADAELAFDTTDTQLAGRLSDLATLLAREGHFEAAEPMLRRALALQRSALGSDHPDVASALDNLGNLLGDSNRFDEAERVLREALAIRRRRFATPHPQIALSLNNLAALLFDRGTPAEAVPLYHETIAMRRRLYGDRHPAVGIALFNLGNAETRLKQWDSAAATYALARPILLGALGPKHPTVASLYGGLAQVEHARDRHAAALQYLASALEIKRATMAADHWSIGSAESDVGRCLADLRRYREAAVHLETAYRILEPRRRDQPARWKTVLERLATVARASGRPADAARFDRLRADTAGTK